MDRKKIIFTTILGNIFEAYDLLVFGLMINYLKILFLPDYEGITLSLLGFLLFSVGYAARPVGAYFLGKIGDEQSRKKSITYSILLLTISTFCIGLLPTYSSIGIFSTIILTILRLIQHFSVSIELIGGSLFLIESFPENQRYLVNSFMFSSSYIGAILGLVVILIINYMLDSTAILNWGWRIPFLLSLPLGLITAYLRIKLSESPQFIKFKKNSLSNNKDKTLSMKEILSNKKIDLVYVTGIFVSFSISLYISLIYIPNILQASSLFANSQAYIITITNYFMIFIFTVIFGYLAKNNNNIGTKILKFSLVSTIWLAVPIYLLLNSMNITGMLLAQIISSILLSMQASTTLATIVNNFEFNTKYSFLNLGLNFSMAIFGGSAPFVIAYLSQIIHPLAPAFYIAITALFTLGCIKKTLNNKITCSY